MRGRGVPFLRHSVDASSDDYHGYSVHDDDDRRCERLLPLLLGASSIIKYSGAFVHRIASPPPRRPFKLGSAAWTDDRCALCWLTAIPGVARKDSSWPDRGVILFADNVAGGIADTRRLTEELQRAAREGHNPPLLIMTDQEGGTVKRLPGPPDLPASAMTSNSMAFKQGVATGSMLRAAGVNVDLAPVADVERAGGSFLGSRAFGSSPSLVAGRACAFAQGLQSQQIAYTLKHFPGLVGPRAALTAGP